MSEVCRRNCGVITLPKIKKQIETLKKFKIWTAVDRDRNKVVSFEISIDENKNEDAICRKLINKIKENYNINIIATDKHWSYNKVMDCNKREIYGVKDRNKGNSNNDNKIITVKKNNK